MVNPRYLHYRKYTPGPDPLAPPPDLTEAVRAIADDVMYGYSAEQALSLIHILEPTRTY